MGARPRTTEKEILDAIANLLSTAGLEGVTMSAVATAVGIQAPSLYKRYKNREAMLRALATRSLTEMRSLLQDQIIEGDDRTSILEMGRTLRTYAQGNQAIYLLIFGPQLAEIDPGTDARIEVSRPILEIISRNFASDSVLPTARLLVSFVHGFISLELVGAFRIDGETAKDFEIALTTLVTNLGF